MKKTFNINLAGYPFIIDEDAYNLLKDYLDTIRYAFDTKDDTGEIAADIESRIAELLLENESGNVRIVTLDEVSQVIARIGKPSEFIDIEEISESEKSGQSEEVFEQEIKMENDKTSTFATPPPYNSSRQYGVPPRKKLFRDPQNSMLGGVCSGLAIYLNMDVTIVRILTVLLFFLSATTVAIAYVIFWIVVPEASTPLQRMQMMGQDPTVENIGRTVTENFQGEEVNLQEGHSKSGFQNFISVFVKCIVILCFIIAVPILLALCLTLVACIVAFFATGGVLAGEGLFGDTFNFHAPGGGVLAFYLLLATIGAIITIGIPVYLLIRMIFKKKNSDNLSINNRSSLLLVWLIGIALTAVFTVKTAKKTKEIGKEEWGWGWNFEDLQTLEDMDIDEEDIETIEVTKGHVHVKTNDGKTIDLSPKGVTIQDDENEEPLTNETEETIQTTDSIGNISVTTIPIPDIYYFNILRPSV